MRRLTAAILVSAGLLGLALSAPASAADVLPDLGMARLSDLRIDKNSDGRKLLRFTTVIVNVGQARFEVRGTRSSTSDALAVSQRIYDDAGGSQDVATTAEMFFAGDGHSHWHVRDLESFVLTPVPDNGQKLGTQGKHGFCFWDNTQYRLSLPGAPQSPFYSGCGSSSSELTVTMGLSVGWGDTYPWNLAYQWVDITGLNGGRYRLTVTADAGGWFAESNESNNAAWVEFQLRANGNALRVIQYGPGV